MDESHLRTTLALIVLGILTLFGIAFLSAWSIDRKRHYLLFLAAGCGLFAAGAVSQIYGLPRQDGPNALLSGSFYTSAVLAVAEGILRRSEKKFGVCADTVLLGIVMLLTAWFFYIDRNLLIRIYIQNFAYGAIFFMAAVRLIELKQGRYVDKVLFWMLLVFALHFFPRTILTAEGPTTVNKTVFADSFYWQALQLSLAVFGTGLALAMLSAAIADVIDDLRKERDYDVLTGILNRRGFEERVSASLRQKTHSIASIALCDVDKFKSINDEFGHNAGDMVLREVGHVLSITAQNGGIVGRLGGEEFAVFFPDTGPAEAYRYAERIRAAVEKNRFSVSGSRRQVTVSFGVGSLTAGETWPDLYKRVDIRLYAAKNAGRNQTVGDDFPRIQPGQKKPEH